MVRGLSLPDLPERGHEAAVVSTTINVFCSGECLCVCLLNNMLKLLLHYRFLVCVIISQLYILSSALIVCGKCHHFWDREFGLHVFIKCYCWQYEIGDPVVDLTTRHKLHVFLYFSWPNPV
jgi:hypothetical protein